MRAIRTNSARHQPAADLDGIVAGLADLIAARVADMLGKTLKAHEQPSSGRAKADYLSEAALAEKTGISRRTLQMWRRRGRGPRWVKMGNRVLYDARALDELLAR